MSDGRTTRGTSTAAAGRRSVRSAPRGDGPSSTSARIAAGTSVGTPSADRCTATTAARATSTPSRSRRALWLRSRLLRPTRDTHSESSTASPCGNRPRRISNFCARTTKRLPSSNKLARSIAAPPAVASQRWCSNQRSHVGEGIRPSRSSSYPRTSIVFFIISSTLPGRRLSRAWLRTQPTRAQPHSFTPGMRGAHAH